MKTRLSFLILLAAMLAIASVSVFAADKTPIVSPGLNILAANTDMAKTALTGDNIGFTDDDFRRALNLSEIRTLTVVSLPAPEEGKLMLGTAELSAGKSVSGSNLDLMTFVPTSDKVERSSFTFETGAGYCITCNLYFLPETNYSPTVSLAADNSLSVRTHASVSRTGRLEAYDPEGDAFVYEIVSYPENGSLILTNRSDGSYVYTPASSFTGKDSFSYVARDVYGNYSSAATVSVNVQSRTTSVIYDDIEDCNVYNAALTMAEKSIMSATAEDGISCFAPGQSISRAEFLACAMQAAGITDPGSDAATVFADDEDIPVIYKGYIATAYRLGFVSGSNDTGELCFLPNATVTRAEAAVMLNAVISSVCSVEEPILLPVFADTADVPSWASDAIYLMTSLGIFDENGGYASPDAVVTRGDAACMFEEVVALCEG